MFLPQAGVSITEIHCYQDELSNNKGGIKAPGFVQKRLATAYLVAWSCQVYRTLIEHSCSAGELAYKVAMLPFFL